MGWEVGVTPSSVAGEVVFALSAEVGKKIGHRTLLL